MTSLNDNKVLLINDHLSSLPVLEFQAMFSCEDILSKGEICLEFGFWTNVLSDRNFSTKHSLANMHEIPLKSLKVWLENLYIQYFDDTMLLIHLSYLRSCRIPIFSNKNIPL